MTPSDNKPLLTFALVSYNQEPFVREAVEAALAQTYSPLQIILSDDYSDDRSFEIMREMAQAYRGPHQLTLNRNPSRKIMGGHMNRVLELSRGELIVIAAADDVSLPNRTEVVYQAWERSGRRAASIYSDYIQIDEAGKRIDRLFHFADEHPAGEGRIVEQKVNPLSYVKTLKPTVHGCSHAICPRLYRRFGNLPDEVVYEDKVLAFRSVLGGKLVYINEPLVKYRLHGANMDKYLKSSKGGTDLKGMEQQENRFQRNCRNAETMYGAFVYDLETAWQGQLISRADFEGIAREAERRRKHFFLMGKFLESGMFRKIRILPKLWRVGLDRKESRTLLPRLVPRPLFLFLRLARNFAVQAWSRVRR